MEAHIKRRILSGCEGKVARINRNENSLDTLLGVGTAVNPRGTNCQRTRGCALHGSPGPPTTFDANVRQLNPNQVPPRQGAEMHTTFELHAENADAAFARRAAGHADRRWGATLLHQRNLARSRHYRLCHRLIETASVNNCLRPAGTFSHKIVLSELRFRTKRRACAPTSKCDRREMDHGGQMQLLPLLAQTGMSFRIVSSTEHSDAPPHALLCSRRRRPRCRANETA